MRGKKKSKKNTNVTPSEGGGEGGGGGGDGGEDRLSNLPDSIIQSILSLLEFKQAMQTSVLSKSWRHHWKYRPVLDFDSQSFSMITHFYEHVLSVLSGLHNRALAKLRFYTTTIDIFYLCQVFRYISTYGVEHLILGLPNMCYTLPNHILTLKSLKTLDLTGIVLPESFASSTITDLQLDYCFLLGGGQCLDPFAGCPKLNKLCLRGCSLPIGPSKTFRISAPELVYLTIESKRWYPLWDYKFEISAPKVASFRFEDIGDSEVSMDFSLIDLPSLQYVEIDVSMPYEQSNGSSVSNLFKLLKGLHNAEFVTLSSSTIKALNRVPKMLEDQPSPFDRLKSLILRPRANCFHLKVSSEVINYLRRGSPSAVIKLGKLLKMA